MTLDLHYEGLGDFGSVFRVGETGHRNLQPVMLIVQKGPWTFQDYLSSADARRLAWALIDQANRADVRAGKAGADPNLVARAEAA